MAKWQKGQSGNPNGRRPNEQAITPMLRRLLAEKGQDGQTRAERVASVLLHMATAGDIDAIKVVLDRVDGKVVAPVDVTTDGQMIAFKAYVGVDPSKV